MLSLTNGFGVTALPALPMGASCLSGFDSTIMPDGGLVGDGAVADIDSFQLVDKPDLDTFVFPSPADIQAPVEQSVLQVTAVGAGESGVILGGLESMGEDSLLPRNMADTPKKSGVPGSQPIDPNRFASSGPKARPLNVDPDDTVLVEPEALQRLLSVPPVKPQLGHDEVVVDPEKVIVVEGQNGPRLLSLTPAHPGESREKPVSNRGSTGCLVWLALGVCLLSAAAFVWEYYTNRVTQSSGND